MERSTFLKILTGGSLLALASARMLTISFDDATVSLIRNELQFLRLEEKGLRQFATDFARTVTLRSYRYKIKAYSFLGVGSGRSGKVNYIVTTYLLSTNFFQNGMDESKLVEYVGLYSPYLRPCAHPFSNAQYA